MKHFDIAVIGAGPAGANFARLADSEKYKILVIHNEGYEKPCGGLLSPDAARVLAAYDLTLPAEILASPQIFAVRVIDLESGLCKRYPRHYLNMKRSVFDAWLRSFIPPQVTVVCGKCVQITDYGNSFSIRLANGETYTADKIVGADGASSLVRRTFFPENKCRRYTAIQQQFRAKNGNAFYSCIYDAKTSPACSWILFKDDVMTFGGAFSPLHSRKAFEEQKQRLIEWGIVCAEDFSTPLKTEACEVLCPSQKGFCMGNDRIFLIGEAAGFISPSSFEGISYALLSAEALAQAFETDKPKEKYFLMTGKLRLKLRTKAIKCDILSSPFLRGGIMRSGITAIQNQPPHSKNETQTERNFS